MQGKGSALGAYAPFLLMSAASIIPTVGFGVYDRIQQNKQREKLEQERQAMMSNPNLAQWYNQTQGGRM